jgi:hypothetical protein
MAAPKHNRFWTLRSSHGRDRIFSSPEVLLHACEEYFDSVQSNPIITERIFSNGKRMKVKLERPFTLKGLCVFLETSIQTWENYKKREDFFDIISQVENIMFTQKYDRAVNSVFKENIIARELGLADKTGLSFDRMPDDQLDNMIEKIVNYDNE